MVGVSLVFGLGYGKISVMVVFKVSDRETIMVNTTQPPKGKGKGSFYIAQYPVRWTAQSASHFT